MVWELENFSFYLYGKLAYLYKYQKTKKRVSIDDRTREEEMRWQQLIWNDCLGTTKEVNRAVDIPSSMSWEQARARTRREIDNNPLKKCRVPRRSDVTGLTANFPNLDLKDCDIAGKTILYIQVNHIIEKPKKIYTPKQRRSSKKLNSLSWWISKLYRQNFRWSETVAIENVSRK